MQEFAIFHCSESKVILNFISFLLMLSKFIVAVKEKSEV